MSTMSDRDLAHNYRMGACKCSDCHAAYIRETDRDSTLTIDKLIAAKRMLQRKDYPPYPYTSNRAMWECPPADLYADVAKAMTATMLSEREIALRRAYRVIDPPWIYGMDFAPDYLSPVNNKGERTMTDLKTTTPAKPVPLPVSLLQTRLTSEQDILTQYQGYQKNTQAKADEYAAEVKRRSKTVRELEAALKKLGVK